MKRDAMHRILDALEHAHGLTSTCGIQHCACVEAQDWRDLKAEMFPKKGVNPAPERESGISAWDRYWASLDTDSQGKLLAAGIEGARAWFGIGTVWGKAKCECDACTHLRATIAKLDEPLGMSGLGNNER